MGLNSRPAAVPAPDTLQPPAESPAPAVSATSAPTSPQPSASGGVQTRDLAALRARLAGGQTGGVNPPEGAERITPTLIEPRTQETAAGGAEPIAVAPTPAPSASSTADTSASGAELTRGQKAAATRAANKARTVRAPVANAESPAEASGTAADAHAAVVDVAVKLAEGYVGREELMRIAAALEGLLDVFHRRGAP